MVMARPAFYCLVIVFAMHIKLLYIYLGGNYGGASVYCIAVIIGGVVSHLICG